METFEGYQKVTDERLNRLEEGQNSMLSKIVDISTDVGYIRGKIDGHFVKKESKVKNIGVVVSVATFLMGGIYIMWRIFMA